MSGKIRWKVLILSCGIEKLKRSRCEKYHEKATRIISTAKIKKKFL